MLPQIRSKHRDEAGQSIAHYALILAPLVAVVALSVLTILMSGSS